MTPEATSTKKCVQVHFIDVWNAENLTSKNRLLRPLLQDNLSKPVPEWELSEKNSIIHNTHYSSVPQHRTSEIKPGHWVNNLGGVTVQFVGIFFIWNLRCSISGKRSG